jgi:hypothetical protein
VALSTNLSTAKKKKGKGGREKRKKEGRKKERKEAREKEGKEGSEKKKDGLERLSLCLA